jgi:hypothetical protein
MDSREYAGFCSDPEPCISNRLNIVLAQLGYKSGENVGYLVRLVRGRRLPSRVRLVDLQRPQIDKSPKCHEEKPK